MNSAHEEELHQQIMFAELPEPEREYRFAPPRRWRFDFAWPDRGLAVEVEGGTWVDGRHVRGRGFAKDCEKYNTAVLSGWRVLRYTAEQIDDGIALNEIEQALGSIKQQGRP